MIRDRLMTATDEPVGMPARIPTEDLLADLRRVAEELGHPPTTTDYQEHGDHGLTTLKARFDGGWAEILDEAGLDEPPTRYARGGIEMQCPSCGTVHRYSGDRDRYQCPGCNTTVPCWRGRVEVQADNELLCLLATGPKTGDECRTVHDEERPLVERLQAPGRTSKPRGQTTTIYYLYGDERAAIRRFIEENREYVSGCLSDQSNPLQRNWDERLYQMLVEQWRWTQGETGASHQG
jgi:hypothetical protein